MLGKTGDISPQTAAVPQASAGRSASTPSAPPSQNLAAIPPPINPPAPLTSTIPTPAPTPEGTVTPPKSYFWGVQIDGVPFDMSKLDAFEQRTGSRVEIVHWGQPWMHRGVSQDFPKVDLARVTQRDSIPMLDWGSADPQGGMNQPDWQLRKIAEGQYDAYIKKWAAAAKAFGHSFFLRFDHEMNGWWFVWGEQLNNNRPGDYVAAWRHVHDIFTQVGATNVTWVWCVNVDGNPRLTPPAELYPGDAYVDWVAMDGFNWGSNDGSYWQSFYQVFNYTYTELAQLAPTKPLMIAEVASAEKGGPLGSPASKAAWITDAFTEQLPFNFPLVKALVWFDSPGGTPEHTWPLESSSAAIDAFRQAMADAPNGE